MFGQQGMAYMAKLAFFDIGIAGQRNLRTPADLASGMFPYAYDAGARIHSNSWGSTDNVYTQQAFAVDEYMFDNQDFLVLFAAGNDGDEGSGSLGSPATAKNCVTVGAAQSSTESFQAYRLTGCTTSPCSVCM
jgi:hypothetical protein